MGQTQPPVARQGYTRGRPPVWAAKASSGVARPNGLAASDSAQGDHVIYARGRTLSPGLIDLRAHLCEPGHTRRETIATGVQAAARGGFPQAFESFLQSSSDVDPAAKRPAEEGIPQQRGDSRQISI